MRKSKIGRLWVFVLFVACLASLAPGDKVRAETEMPGIYKEILNNGLTVVTDINTTGDIVIINLFSKMGLLVESPTEYGISALMQRALLKGTTSRSGREISLQIETLGASISSAYGSDYGVLTLKTTIDNLPKCLPIFLETVQKPAFIEAEVIKERGMLVRELAGSGDQPVNIAEDNFLNCVYGDHPYGIRTENLAKAIGAIPPKDLADWHRRVYIPQNMVVSIAGRVNAKEITDKIKQTLGKQARGEGINPGKQTISGLERDMIVSRVKPTQSLCVLVGYPAPDIGSPDRVPMDVLNWILSGSGMNSRLFTDLREERGLAYHVSSNYRKMIGPSYIYAYMTTAPQNYSSARDGLIAEFKQFCDVKLSERELRTAQRAMCGRLLIDNETAADRSWNRGLNELLGQGYDFDRTEVVLINRVTAEDIQRVARNYFKHSIVSVVSPTEIQ